MNKSRTYTHLESIILEVMKQSDAAGFEITRTKIQKLLYFIDLRFMDSHSRTATGAKWIWHDYGPFDSAVLEAEEKLSRSGSIVVSEEKYVNGGKKKKIQFSSDPDERYVEETLEQIVADVLSDFGSLSPSEIKKLSYNTPPMLLAQSFGGIRSSSPLDMSAGVQRQDKEERRKRLAKAMRRAKKRRSRLQKREDKGDLSGLVSELEVAKKSIASATEMVL